MLHLAWFTLARRVLHDGGSGNLSLIEVLDAVDVPRFPWSEPGFAFAAYYRRTGLAGELQTDFRLVRSDSRGESTVFRSSGTWSPGIGRMRVWGNFSMLRLYEPGTLEFRLDHRVVGSGWQRGPTQVLGVARRAVDPQEQALLQELAEEGMLPSAE